MNKIIVLVLLNLILIAEGFCQSPPFLRNNSGATINGENLTPGSASVDGKGNLATVATDPSSGETQSVIPVSNAVNLNGVGAVSVGYQFAASDAVEAASTTTVINATSHVARVGDSVSFRTGTAANIGTWSIVTAVTANTITLANALPATPAAADSFYILRPQPLSVNANAGASNSVNSLNVAIDTANQPSAATGLLKLEDAAAANGDALVAVAGLSNVNQIGLVGTDLDYTGLATDTRGNNLSVPVYSLSGINSNISATTREDNAASDAEAGIKVMTLTQDPLTVDQGANNDLAFAKVDRAGRTITTLAPAGEMFQACGTATATTGDVAIKAGVASNRIYTTAITCKNTSATTATSLDFKDGTTIIAVGGVSQMATASAGSFTATFPVPLRGTSNTALNFATNVSTSSVTCCASGYISVN